MEWLPLGYKHYSKVIAQKKFLREAKTGRELMNESGEIVADGKYACAIFHSVLACCLIIIIEVDFWYNYNNIRVSLKMSFPRKWESRTNRNYWTPAPRSGRGQGLRE
jgi:hypothetical protein